MSTTYKISFLLYHLSLFIPYYRNLHTKSILYDNNQNVASIPQQNEKHSEPYLITLLSEARPYG